MRSTSEQIEVDRIIEETINLEIEEAYRIILDNGYRMNFTRLITKRNFLKYGNASRVVKIEREEVNSFVRMESPKWQDPAPDCLQDWKIYKQLMANEHNNRV